MKRVVLGVALIVLAACSSGGGGSNAVPGGGNAGGGGPTPTPVLNGTMAAYLPFAAGNSWTFATGARIQDMGSGPFHCGGCPGEGTSIEQLALYPPNSATIGASFFFTHTGNLTNIIGVENDSGNQNITYYSTTQYPEGAPIMDDNPKANESWSLSGGTSTITSTGGTLSISAGQIVDVAEDQLTGYFNPITWDFAKGVGFTKIGVGSASTAITSFYVSPNSQSIARTKAMTGRQASFSLDTASIARLAIERAKRV